MENGNGENLPTKMGDGVAAFLSEHGGPAGRFIKFNKAGNFVTTDDDEEMPAGTRLICVYDQAQHGWIRFRGKGEPPERKMGPIFGGFVPPPRSELGDEDETQWELGLDNRPKDPTN
jgi:hypothetical protein